MREALGDAYTEALRRTYAGQVPESADLVMFWWYRAAALVRAGQAERFGFITTNSLKQTFNRRVMQPFLEGEPPALALTFAIPDHPWVDSADGAAVRVAFTVASPGTGVTSGQLLRVVSEEKVEEDAAEVVFASEEGRIQPDLTIGADLNSTKALKSNQGICNRGMQPMGAGFIITLEKARALGLGTTVGLEKIILPYRNGRDLTDIPRGVLAIDLHGYSELETATQYPTLYQHLLETVKPERDKNNRASYKKNWWVFGEARATFRPAFTQLQRYIVGPRVAKHRFFVFQEEGIMPDDKQIVIASDDAYFLGIVSSGVHIAWVLAAGGNMGVGNDPVYDNSRCFAPFPFPDATPAQQARIRELAEALDAHRKRQQALHPSLTLTDLYNVVEKLRAGQPLTAREQATHEHGLAAVVLSLHQQLDAAVAAAYHWPADLPAPDLLTRLVQLNHQRRQEEAAGTIRYLRPAYQAPGQQLSALAPAARPTAAPAVGHTGPLPWPPSSTCKCSSCAASSSIRPLPWAVRRWRPASSAAA
jgi:hypothetical protein